MSEAKDWAGELISGQTGTGRILVSILQDRQEQDEYWSVNYRIDRNRTDTGQYTTG